MAIISYYLCEVCLLSVLEYRTIPIYKNQIYNFFSEKYEDPIFCNIYLKKSLFNWYNPAIIGLVFLFLITLVKMYFIHYGKKVCEWENVYHRIVFYIIGVFCSILFFFIIYKRFKRINKELLSDKEDIKNEKE
jgi:flagellar biosynthesis protein FlhB